MTETLSFYVKLCENKSLEGAAMAALSQAI